MPVPLANKPILITGASSGIGRATAIECARAGMFVLVMARREDRLRALVDEINAPGFMAGAARNPGGGSGAGGASLTGEFAPKRPRAALFVGDVTSQSDCDAAVRACIDAFGSVYAVFANAGYGVELPVHEMTDAQMRDIFECNLFGSLNIIRAALPPMLKAGAGHVLWCSSCLAKLPMPTYGAYCATKAAQHHLSRAMGVELRPVGVRVTSVHPVGTKTEFFDTAVARSDGKAPMSSRAPEWSMQPPEKVARLVVRCLRSPKPEVWASWSARLLFPMLGLAPRLTDWVLARGAAKAAGKR